jgi:glycosyltransferase involved in cell wall biosynthesis
MLFITKRQKANILILHPETDIWRGPDTDLVTKFNMFEKNKYKIYFNYNKKIFLKIKNKNFKNIKMINLKKINIIKFCKKKLIDIIICSDFSCVDLARLAKEEIGTKVMLMLHLPLDGFYKFDYKKLNNLDCVICVNEKIKKDLIYLNKNYKYKIKIIDFLFPFCEKKIIKIKNISRSNYFKKYFDLDISKNKLIICIIGNMYNNLIHKNYPFLFNCIKKIKQKYNLKFLIAGNGTKKNYLQNLSENMGLQEDVSFLGFVENIPLLLAHCDVFLLPSSEEAFGLVYLEAGAMGLPLIGANNTGADFIIIDQVTGFLFKNSCEDSLVECLEKVINNNNLLKELGKNAQEHVISNFSNKKLFEKLEIILKKILL